jgi:hypothetical protein
MKRTYLLAVALFIVSIAIVGCSTKDLDRTREYAGTAEQITAAVADQVDTVTALQADIDAAIAEMDDGDTKTKLADLSAKLGEAIVTGEDVLAKAETALATFNAEMTDAGEALDVLDAGAKAVGPILPPPWGTILVGVVGLATTVASLIRARSNRQAGKAAILSVDDVVAKALKGDKDLAADIRRAQGAATARLVDEAQGKVPARPV